MRLQDIAALVSGKLEHGDPDADITGIQTLEKAGLHDASFLSNPRYKGLFESSAAGVIFIHLQAFPETDRPVIRVADPYLAFALLQRHFHPSAPPRGVRDATALIDVSAKLAADVDVGAGAVIGRRVRIGSGTRIGAGCIIEDDAVIGRCCELRPRVVIARGCILGNNVLLQAGAVIGSDGFGYAWNGREFLHIPHTGRAVLGDGVEIGANTCVDRGVIGDTVIEHGVKLDNLIQIAHNVRIGAHSILASQVGISGSAEIGKGCQLGGQVGVAGHLHIGDECRIAAKSGVPGDLKAGGTYAGIPAMPHRLWLKVSALLLRLPDMWKLLRGGK